MSLADRGDMGEQSKKLVGSDRVLAILVALGERVRGASLEELARAVDSPKPTVHRGLAALRRAGLADQRPDGTYVLGDNYVRLALRNLEAWSNDERVGPVLERLVERFGETAHYATLEADRVIYRAKKDPILGPVKLTSRIGGENPIHSTAVGKLLFAYRVRSLEDVRELERRVGFPARTEYTVTDPGELYRELLQIREQGYAVDRQENETGINCLAVPYFFSSTAVPDGAISVSALTYRTPLADLEAHVEEIRAIVGLS